MTAENDYKTRLDFLRGARDEIQRRLDGDPADYAVANLVRELRQVLAEIEELEDRPVEKSTVERLADERRERRAEAAAARVQSLLKVSKP